MYAGAALVSEMTGMKKARVERKDPFWKRRIEGDIRELQSHLYFVEKLVENKRVKKKNRDILQKKYKIDRKKVTVVKEEIRQRLVAKKEKIKRYTSRINQFQQNRTFSTNQGRFYKNLNSGNEEAASEVPDANEAKAFWSNIWSQEKQHNGQAQWIEDFKEECEGKEKQGKIEITEEKMMKIIRKMPNWKAPGPDGVQGYWVKNFKCIHTTLANHLQKCLSTGEVPDWMTKGNTYLIQKDKIKGTVV